MAEEEHLTAKEVASKLKMEASTFAKYRKRQPDFPPPIDIGPTEKGKPIWRWKLSEINAFLTVREYKQRKAVEVEDDADD